MCILRGECPWLRGNRSCTCYSRGATFSDPSVGLARFVQGCIRLTDVNVISLCDLVRDREDVQVLKVRTPGSGFSHLCLSLSANNPWLGMRSLDNVDHCVAALSAPLCTKHSYHMAMKQLECMNFSQRVLPAGEEKEKGQCVQTCKTLLPKLPPCPHHV